MPNRMIRDWTDSEKVNSLTVHAERFFTRLIMKADDFGIYPANTKLMKSMLFPLLTDSVREADISRWITECETAGLIVFYEVSSKPYVQIIDFRQRLRQKMPKYPQPKDDCHMSVKCRSDDGLKRRELEGKGRERAHEEIFSVQPPDTSFLPPSQAQCEEFFNGAGFPHLGQKFFLHYKSTGWQGVRDWLARAQKWALDENNKLKPNETVVIHKPK